MNSIRRRLTLAILTGFGLLLIFSGTAIYFFTRVALLNEFDAGLRAKALTIMSLTEQGQDGIQFDLPDFLKGSEPGAMPQLYKLWQTNGTVVACSESLHEIELPIRLGSSTKPKFWNLNLANGHTARAIGLRFSPKADDESTETLTPVQALVVVAADRQAIDQTLKTLAIVLALTGLLTTAFTVPVVNVSLRRGHAPLAQLARAATAITADSLQSRFPADSMPEELQPITSRLNDLLGRLEDSFERERRFSADLAHELRTPLAELRSLAEVELAWPEGENSEIHQETLEIAVRMEGIVTQLLEMTRGESGKISLQMEFIALAPLVNEVWCLQMDKAQKKNLNFTFDVPPDAMIQSDRVLLLSILSNLLANAVEYSPQNGLGEIRWHDKTGELSVSNNVYDLNADDVPHLFERLWRKDKSRTGGDHCGLGLALSRTFAGLLGFDLRAHFSGQKTLTISIGTRRDLIAADR